MDAKNPKSVLREVLQRVESVTGYPVHVQEESQLPTIATVRAATASSPYTRIRYRSSAAPAREYLVVYQGGFVLRQHALDAGERWEIKASDAGRQEVASSVQRDFADRAETDAFTETLLGGLLTQLRSLPVGLRIDEWIGEEFPSLADQQKRCLELQIEEGFAVLAPAVRQAVPERVYNASVTMNAAMASHWASVWKDSRLVVPYKAAGFAEGAELLLESLADIDPAPANDRALIAAWALGLGIENWFEFVQLSEEAS
jgi:hypothetical protein